MAKNSVFEPKIPIFLAKFGGTPPPPFAGGKLHNNFCGIGGYPRPPPLYGKKLQISIYLALFDNETLFKISKIKQN